MSMHAEDGGFRLSMVHVWLGAENPDGVLAQNNWTLPFLKAGMPAPARASSEAARALSLSSDEGMAFYGQLLREGVGLRGEELDLAVATFEESARAARAAAATSEVDVRALEAIWTTLWTDLERALSSQSLGAMSPLRS
jgi:hypothetical protein